MKRLALVLLCGLAWVLLAAVWRTRPRRLCRNVPTSSSAWPTTSEPGRIAGIYGDRVIKVPTFDRVAREGVLFNYCFSAAPTCTASRGAILSGQYPHRLEDGGNLWGTLPKKFPVYPDAARSGRLPRWPDPQVGWGPGDFRPGGYTQNPAGRSYRASPSSSRACRPVSPSASGFGSHDPHRPYEVGSGKKLGLDPAGVKLPAFWPDAPEVREDVLDYYAAVERFDREVGEMLDLLQKAGQLDNTLVVMSGDNGWPFPRCKSNVCDGGTRQPLAVRWPARVPGGRVLDDFVNLMDLAPTFLEAAGQPVPPEMTGRSIVGLLTGTEKPGSRQTVFVERERHANVRQGDKSYPIRAIRTREFLYIRNFRPDLWPAGDPEMWKAVGPFGDCDDGLTKQYILAHRDDPAVQPFFQLCFGKRPAEELYDLKADPDQLHNLAGQPAYADSAEPAHLASTTGCTTPPTPARRTPPTTAGTNIPTTVRSQRSRNRKENRCATSAPPGIQPDCEGRIC